MKLLTFALSCLLLTACSQPTRPGASPAAEAWMDQVIKQQEEKKAKQPQ